MDGLAVAANHFNEDENRTKVYKEKRVIVLTDFGCRTDNDEDLEKLCKRLVRQEIRVDVVSAELGDLGGEDSEGRDEGKARGSGEAGSEERRQAKMLTPEQRRVQEVLNGVCTASEGALYSFEEALTLLSRYQAKAVKSSGTKYMLRLGETFRMPIVSVIKCKESKPDLFKFKKVFNWIVCAIVISFYLTSVFVFLKTKDLNNLE